jgi:hypothetical protein
MLLLIDIVSINKGRGYENPSLDIIVTERCSTGGCPLEEACEHCYLIQSAISVAILYIISVYCEDYAGYFTVILSFLAFHFCSAYFIYLVSCKLPIKINTVIITHMITHKNNHVNNNATCKFITQLALILERILPTACIPSMNLPALDHTVHHSQQ